MDPYGNDAAVDVAGQGRRHRLRHGVHAAHHARAVDGRAVEPGQSGRLPGGHRRGGGIRPGAADDDDGSRHRACRKGVRDGRRRRRPAGDRHGAAPRRRGDGDRRQARGQGTGRLAGRQIPGGRGRGVQGGRDRRRLRQGNVEGIPGQAGGADGRPHRQAGHRHHHGADPRPAGAEAGLGGDGRLDEAGLGDRRSCRRARRQCRRRRAGRGGRHRQRRQDRRPSQRAGPGRGVGVAALRQEPLRLPRDDGRQGGEGSSPSIATTNWSRRRC